MDETFHTPTTYNSISQAINPNRSRSKAAHQPIDDEGDSVIEDYWAMYPTHLPLKLSTPVRSVVPSRICHKSSDPMI